MSGWHFSLLQWWSLLLLLLEKVSGASSWGGFLLEMWSLLLLLEQVGGGAASSWGGRIPPGRELASKCTCCLREDDGVNMGSWELSSFARLLLGLLLRIRLSCGAIPSQLSLLSGGYSSSSSFSSSDGFLSLSLSLSHEQALATMRVVVRVQNNRTESHSLPLFWIAPVSHLHCSSTHFSFLFSECDHHNTRRFYRQACGNDDRQTKSLLLGFSCVCICVCFCVWVQKLARLLILPKGEKGLKNGVKEAGAKKICKFTESAWKLTYYLSTEICVVWITYKEPWFTDTSTFWHGWPHQTLKYWIFCPHLPFQSSQFSQLFL